MKLFRHPPLGITVHHSLTRDGTILNNTAAIRKYHMSPAQNGVTISMEEYREKKRLGESGLKDPWEENGYHVVIERVNGMPWPMWGRPLCYEGAHCPELNATHLGVCVCGDFDKEPPDLEMFRAIVSGIKGLFGFFPHLNHTHVNFHNQYSNKSCPGSLFPETALILALSNERRPS